MKLEAGMYVRTKEGIITKIIDNRDNVIVKTDDNTTHLRSMITKASNNLIDLIEEGDYVNGLPVTRICIDDETNEKYLNMFGSISEYRSEDIKSIVTKEQFDSMKYEVDSNE